MFLASLLIGFTAVFFPWMILFFLVKPEYFPLLRKNRPFSRPVIFGLSFGFLLISIITSGLLAPTTPDNVMDLHAGVVLLGALCACLYWFFLVASRSGKSIFQMLGVDRERFLKDRAFLRSQKIDEKLKDRPVEHQPVHHQSSLSFSQKYSYWMMYSDVEGVETAREFNIIRIYQKHNRWYFDADCALVEDERTFRVDRVQMLKANYTNQYYSLEKDIRKYFRDLSRDGIY